MKDLSLEVRIYLALWRKALREKSEIFVAAPTYNTALSIRMSMYRAIRPYREGKIFDDELSIAANEFVLMALKDPAGVKIVPRITHNVAKEPMEALGLTDEDLLSPDELARKQAMEKVQKELSIPESELPANPFFKREN